MRKVGKMCISSLPRVRHVAMSLAMLVLALLFAGQSHAQKSVGAAEQATMIQKVEAAAGKTGTLQCQFVQTKQLSLLNEKMVSRGVMYYQKGGKLRWEYTTPYAYTFLLNGNSVMLKSAKKKDVIDVQSSRMFKEIARIMMNSVTGQCLSSKEDFKVTMYRSSDNKEWQAELVPLKKQMKQMFSVIRLHIDPAKGVVTKVEMTEKTGDTTTIELTNTKVNAPIDAKVFSLD